MKNLENVSTADIIRQALTDSGLENPILSNGLTDLDKIEELEVLFEKVIKILGLDLRDDSLCGSPKRIAKMFTLELFKGLNYDNFPKITLIDNKLSLNEMVKVDDIKVSSVCEHHFITIDGFAKVAYIPNKKIIGLSKINRIVDFFARRPQVQERLTKQIQHVIKLLLDTESVAISISAVHYCVKARGIMDQNSKTTTVAYSGEFLINSELRSEFRESI
ncbi:GTP cyclohydrolase I FolE [Vibrio lentus]|uniref:GTP cyclohydrolase I FolE n=1 Tax=Vibrio lentus TaxID=136468 RepID=UPI000C8360C7|nr:GTP cyclohydrolase I FolE [Vibrio lentus]PMI94083.1 GTP cyclohydrolase I FolE [Vibrio lentus]